MVLLRRDRHDCGPGVRPGDASCCGDKGPSYGKYAGEPCGIVDATESVEIPYGKTKALSVFAPGAVRYRWALNGETIAAAEGETYDVPWQRIKTAERTATYTVTPIYLKDGVETDGEAKELTVKMRPCGLSLILR